MAVFCDNQKTTSYRYSVESSRRIAVGLLNQLMQQLLAFKALCHATMFSKGINAFARKISRHFHTPARVVMSLFLCLAVFENDPLWPFKISRFLVAANNTLQLLLQQRASTMDDATQAHHGHKPKKAGRGAKEVKKDKRAKKEGSRVERHNHRAFSVANIGRTQRTIQRNLDRGQKKEYVPLNDRRAQDPSAAPPSLVVVMGPPGVGKVRFLSLLL